MQTAQRIIRNYRRRRIALSCVSALIVLVITFGVSFVLARHQNNQRLNDFSARAIAAIDGLISHADGALPGLLPLVGEPCSRVQLKLRTIDSQLQTTRSIALVDNGFIYCSSVFGERLASLRAFNPQLPAAHPILMLAKAQTLLKGTPILIKWQPLANSATRGVFLTLNIDLLAGLILSPEHPWVMRSQLRVGDQFLRYGPESNTSPSVLKLPSSRYPYTIELFGPPPDSLAIKSLPSQIPLAFLLSMAVGYLAWLASARRMSFSWEINQGIACQEFCLFCQPLIDSRSRACVGVEILLRWNNPRQGWLSPELFIPLAEENDLIAPLTCYLLQQLTHKLHLFPANPQFHIGVNAAPVHFEQEKIISDLQRYWFTIHPIQRLVLEITERHNLQHIPAETFQKLQALGIELAIDDFGTGRTSLAWLEHLRPDILKIDKTFINAIGLDVVNSQVVDIIIALSQRLKIALVAEGVESESQADWLRERQVGTFQGYLYAKPMPLDDFPAWLSSWNVRPGPFTNPA